MKKIPFLFLLIPLFLVDPVSASSDPKTTEYLERLNRYYYCLSREGLKSFRCDVSASFSLKLPKEFKQKNKNAISETSSYPYILNYLGGETNPVFSPAPDAPDDMVKNKNLMSLIGLMNRCMEVWAGSSIEPLFQQDDNLTYSLIPRGKSGFTVSMQNATMNLSCDFDPKAMCQNLRVYGPNGTQNVQTSFFISPKGPLLNRFQVDDGKGNLVVFNIKYQTIEGFQLPSSLVVFVGYPEGMMKITFLLTNYKIRGTLGVPPAGQGNDVQIVTNRQEVFGAKHFFWRVKSPTATVYLLGSIHIRPDTPLQLPEVIEKGFESSNFVGFEYDLSKEEEVKNEMQKSSGAGNVYPSGDSLLKHLGPEQWKIVRSTLRENGINEKFAVHLKPAVLAGILGELALKREGLDYQMGIDHIFLRKAQTGRKSVFGLEYWWEPFKDNVVLGEKEQIDLLMGVIKNLNNTAEFFNSTVEAWKKGDTWGLEALLNSNMLPEEKQIDDKIVRGRNEKWIGQLNRVLATRATYFIVVGSAHLVGQFGLPTLLRSKGYSVEQL